MSLSSKISLSIAQCLAFAEDNLFQRARGALRDAGKLKEWFDLVKSNNDRKIEEIIEEKTMDNVLFLQDRFEILIDARGFRLEDIKCSMTPNIVEVIAQKQEKVNNTTKSMTLTRTYQLPQIVKPEDGSCCFSSEGVLLITAPWLK